MGALSLPSCTFNSLSLEKAKELIEDFYDYPNVETAEFSLDLNLAGLEQYQKLIDDGYFSFSQFSQFVGVSEKAEPYKAGVGRGVNFVTNLRYFKEVTGIRYENDDKTKAIVEFAVERRKITPFGEQKGYIEGDIEPYHLEFQKYDDAWRISSEATQNILPNNFTTVEEFNK